MISETKKMLDNKNMILRASDIVDWVQFDQQLKITDKLVHQVFKEEFGLRY